MKITDEIKAFVKNLYDAGYRGTSNAFKGMRPKDEEQLASFLLQSAGVSIDDIDDHRSMYGILARYMRNPSADQAVELADHLKSLFTNYFKDDIQVLMETEHAGSSEGLGEEKAANQERERDIAAFNKQRI